MLVELTKRFRVEVVVHTVRDDNDEVAREDGVEVRAQVPQIRRSPNKGLNHVHCARGGCTRPDRGQGDLLDHAHPARSTGCRT